MHQYSTELTQAHIAVTDTAKEKVAGLLKDAGNQVAAVRVYVYGGGCSGMKYGMTFAEQKEETDSMMEEGDVKIVVDPVALGFLKGAEIDYADDGVNASFVFNNVFQSVGGSGSCGGCGSA
ncbi:MAG: iron-sulfur cluster assembly accessory protein [Arenicellales bacterium]